MDRFSEEVIKNLVDLLTLWGVPAGQAPAFAMATIYVGATLLVVLLLLLLFRLRRREPPPSSPEPEREEAPRAEPPRPPEVEPVPEEEEVEIPAVKEEPVKPPVSVQPPGPAEKIPVPEISPREGQVPVGLWERMRSGLAKTRTALAGPIDQLLAGRPRISQDLLEEIEEVLVTADFGINTAQNLVASLQERFSGKENPEPEAIRNCLKDSIVRLLSVEAPPLDPGLASPFVIMIVGVNGAGKTTSIGKLAHHFRRDGRSVLLGAGDTFRAAAADQLAVWGERTGSEVIRQQEGSDPAAVAFDTVRAALKRGAGVVLLDTAGRLHTKTNLMEEIKKIRRVLEREMPGAPHETLLVLDATTGQNALAQARMFSESVKVSGVILTKLDGSAKGGVVVPIAAELGLPVRFVGIGEGVEDLRPFDPVLFASALFAKEG